MNDEFLLDLMNLIELSEFTINHQQWDCIVTRYNLQSMGASENMKCHPKWQYVAILLPSGND